MIKSVCIFLFCITTSLFAQDAWVSFKNETVLEMNTIPGWCSSEKALLMMDVIKENKCQYCVEVGVFSGMSLFPIAKALQYNGSGKVFAIDAWDPFEAIKGFSSSDPNYVWWSQLDFNYFYRQTLTLINKNKLNKFCNIIKQPSHNAACLFVDETIDFIHLDGNHNEEFAFQDVIDYFPKVKDSGYILLNDPNWFSMKRSLVFLLERADLVSLFSPSATYFLFRKNNQRAENANILFSN
jgi:hypothetical protein